MLFDDIKNFIALNSFGPVSILFTDVANKRFGLIQPYNYYLINECKQIYLLLESSKLDNNKEIALRFTENETTKVEIYIKKYEIYNIFKNTRNTKHKKILLQTNKLTKSELTKKIRIENLLNNCLELGIFEI